MVPESLEENLRRIDDLGGPDAHNHYPWGWAWAGNTPLKRWKRETHEGGVTDPLIVWWPDGIGRPGEVRHAVRARDRRAADAARRHRHRRARRDRGRAAASARRRQLQAHVRRRRCAATARHAVLRDARLPRHLPRRMEGGHVPSDGRLRATTAATRASRSTRTTWELYHVAEDFSETVDLADQEPERLRSSIDLWWSEAERNQVFPLTNQPGRHGDRRFRRERYEYHAGIGVLPPDARAQPAQPRLPDDRRARRARRRRATA